MDTHPNIRGHASVAGRWLPWHWIILSLGLLSLVMPSLAQEPVTMKIAPTGVVKPHHDLEFKVIVHGDQPSFTYWWSLLNAQGLRVFYGSVKSENLATETSGDKSFSFTVPASDVKTGHYSAKVEVYAGGAAVARGSERVTVGTPPAPPKPPKPTFHHRLQGGRIYGPTKIKVGEQATWEGVPDGGEHHHYEWHFVKKGSSTNYTLHPSDPTKVIATFKRPTDFTLILWIWDNEVPREKAVVDRKEVQVVGATETEAAGPITGWWIWRKPGTNAKGQSIVRHVPVHLTSNRGIYTGAIYYSQFKPGHIKNGHLAGNVLTYDWEYQSGENGLGDKLEVSGSSMSGEWHDRSNGTSGHWELVRPNQAQLAKLHAMFTGLQ